MTEFPFIHSVTFCHFLSLPPKLPKPFQAVPEGVCYEAEGVGYEAEGVGYEAEGVGYEAEGVGSQGRGCGFAQRCEQPTRGILQGSRAARQAREGVARVAWRTGFSYQDAASLASRRGGSRIVCRLSIAP